ncbi:AAA domain-containing protein [Thermotoga profunda]|uniref:AAA domain-containing protein n=1 Tax=Thermotoga profunda TaxID=1508420 RepID=UPI000B05A700|nr:AAA domain-containing protein [Thermotoga profunda]
MEISQAVIKQIRVWQDRLLNLSANNPLLAVDQANVSKLLVKDPDMFNLFDILVERGKELNLPFVVYDYENDEYVLKDQGDIQFEIYTKELEKKIKRLHMLSKTSIEEKGIVSLFITFGVLKLKDPEFLVPYLSFPIILTPCELTRKGPYSAFKINALEEETQLNPILELLFREKYKIPFPQTEKIDLKEIIHYIENLLKQYTDWRILPQSWLLNLNPETIVIRNDLENIIQNSEIRSHPIIESLAGMPRQNESKKVVQSIPLVPVLEADSSQIDILRRVRNGENLVVHGPPGTGKSQTIVNIIADALICGKTVLFVSAKKAALDVVYERLKNIGLDRFCLEVHSTRKAKVELISDLKKTIDQIQTEQPFERPEKLIEHFKDLKNYLDNSLKALHWTDYPLGISVYDAILRLEQMKDSPGMIHPLPFSRITEVPKKQLEEYLQILTLLEDFSDMYTKMDQHPWNGFQFQNNLLPYPAKVIEFVEYVKVNLEDLKQILEKIGFSNVDELNFKILQEMAKTLNSLTQVDVFSIEWFRMSQEKFEKILRVLRDYFKAIDDFSSLSKICAEHTSKSVEELAELLSPVECVYNKWTRILKPSYWKWMRYVNTKLNYPHNFEQIRNLYFHTKMVLDSKRKIIEQENFLNTYINVGSDLKRLKITLKEMEIAFEITKLVRNPERFIQSDLIIDDGIKELILKALKIVEDLTLKKVMHDLEKLWPNGFANSKSVFELNIDKLLDKIKQLLENETRLHEWVRFQEIVQKLEELNLISFIERVIKDNKDNLKNIRKIFEKNFYKQWVGSICSQNVYLKGFSKEIHERTILKLRETEEKLRQDWTKYIKSTTSLRIRNILNLPNEFTQQIRILMREIQKKRRHKPIRRLFQETSDVFRYLKPCIFMSPISVASFLDLKKYAFYFDIVIFDEASQLMTPEAIPAIVRGKQIVVAGDPKQLPPTTFFKSYYELEDTDDEFKPLESFLDDCIASPHVFSNGYLKWHYRSRDERLIAFSNYYFYGDNPLITFPSINSNSDDQGVRLVYVNGVWDRAKSRTNPIEAQKVVDIVIEHLNKHPERSLGVVTMNISQRNLIEDLLYKALEKYPHLFDIVFAPSNEPFFIKSLENVQGDERDTIIISVGYAQSPSGKISYNFGPLNYESGWRRLNVLVTRARYQIILVTSLKSSDLSEIKPDNRGAMALKNYIEYAERGCKLSANAFKEECNDILPNIVASKLNEKGILTDVNVGLGLCRIDIVIKDSKDSKKYLMGFIHDGKDHMMISDAFDREVLKFKVLERLGWPLKRIWTLEWYMNSNKVIEDISV